MNKSTNTQNLLQDPSYPLITRERTDKLDLLQHLTANLARSVIVLGPEGVGKTRLLKLFKDTLPVSSVICTFNGDSLLTLEKIQGQISETIALKIPGCQPQTLSETLGKLVRQDAGAVLIIDDAGKLAPGVMEPIIWYANENPALRIVFALTHNELYLKNTTDSAIDDCYQIEIPPLTELQCADFLEYLSTLPNPRIDFSAINETMIADLFRETHGIPGRILDKLPKPRSIKNLDYSAAILTCAVTGLIAIALGVQWWSSRPKPVTKTAVESKVNQQTVPSQQPEAAKLQQQQAAVPPQYPDAANLETNNATAAQQNSTAAGQAATTTGVPQVQTNEPTKADVTTAQPQSPTTVPPPVDTAVNTANTTPVTMQTTQPLDEGSQWVMQQPAENITLQLMALSDKETILEVMQRHQGLGQNLKYLKTTTRRGKDRYVLLYGSFANQDEAGAEAKKLPNELRKAWVRKMTSLQAELNPALPSPAAATTPPH